MKNSKPLVSIIIPTYNRKDLLCETLNSVRNQIFENWECIVVDDGSTDATEEMLKELIDVDGRFNFLTKPLSYPKGASFSRNFGFIESKGDYIQWLDDDDLLAENKLSAQIKELEVLNNPNVYAMCSWDLYWSNKPLVYRNSFSGQKYVNKENFFSNLGDCQTFIPPLAYLIPRQLVIKTGLWNTELSINQDAEFFTRIMLNADHILNVEDCFVLYRQHDGVRISGRREKSDIESFILSLNLIQSYLKAYNIEAKNYFKWKLLKWFLAYYKLYPRLFKKHFHLFKENGININWSYYYFLKYKIYRKIYPVYKRFKIKK